MTNIGTLLYTLFNGMLVGQDEFGNKYYLHKRANKLGRRKRWVIYNGIAEASKVPAYWHGWLHYTTDDVPKKISYAWQKPHKPNLTGTKYAYFPPGHRKSGGVREKATGDYEAWRP